MEEKCAGRRLEPAILVGNKVTSGRIVEWPKRTGSLEEEATISTKDDFISIGPDYNNKDLEEKVVFDRAEERLDSLEGSLIEDEAEICLMYEEDDRIEEKVYDTLRKHVEFWHESGPSYFAVSTILNGYVPQMQRKPERYQEKNNK